MTCNNDYCEIEPSDTKQSYPEIRNLDECYFSIKRDDAFVNVCFSDMTEAERGKVMSNKTVPWLIGLCNHLAESLHSMGDAFDIYCHDHE